MADKYPNLPGIVVDHIESRLLEERAALGPTPVVIGTASKGTSLEESRVLSGPGAVSKYGLSGSLARGLTEAFQGGADNAHGFRVAATKGKLSRVGDVTGAAGMSVEPVVRGSDALEQYEILYSQDDDELKVYEVSSGDLVYHKAGAVVTVDEGLINLAGSMASGNDGDHKAGSIGLQVAVADDETTQQFDSAGCAPKANEEVVITMQDDDGSLNLNILHFDATDNPYVAQLRDKTGAVLNEAPLSAVDAANDQITLAVGSTDINDGAFRSQGVEGHQIRFISTVNAIRMDRVVDNRLGIISGASELDLLPGSDFNGQTRVINSAGKLADTSASEAEPSKMNLYEALSDAGLALEASDFDGLVLMDAYADDPALDGQSSGETALPSKLFTVTKSLVEAGQPLDRHLIQLADAATAAAAAASLKLAGTGGTWVVIEELKGAAFGANHTADELVRSARILNHEYGVEVSSIDTVADAAGSLDGKYWTFDDGTTEYYVWYDIAGDPGDPAVAGKTGIKVDIGQGDAAGVVATKTKTAIDLSAARVDLSIAGVDNDEITMTNWDAALVTAAADGTAGFTIASDFDASKHLWLHLDRELTLSVDGNGDAAVQATGPATKVYETDLLFYHREKEIGGELLHQWYTAKADPDGHSYSEVNFAYKLAKVCFDISANETSVIGTIGVRPPSNHFSAASLSTWIGKSAVYDENGDVATNGTGLLGWKFVAGRALDGDISDQFSPGFLETTTGELDGSEAVLDSNGYEVDLGKFISVVGTWPLMTNTWDVAGFGYIASGAPMYAGLLAGLAPWAGSTAKRLGGANIRLARALAKRHLNSLTGARYVMLSERAGNVTVVDGPSAALPSSDYTRNMTIRLVADAMDRVRDVARPFLGDPLDALKKIGLETQVKKALSDVQTQSGGALESFTMGLTQTSLDKARGTAKVTLSLQVINELRKINVEVALSL